jgi:monothiol glutaredoxin
MPLSSIPDLLGSAPVVAFIKGTPEHPMCGFSRIVVRILDHLKVPFASFDVLQDPDLRQNLKTFSNWPTFPQLYLNGELIGGCDIAQEMFSSGELAELLGPYAIDTEVVSGPNAPALKF